MSLKPISRAEVIARAKQGFGDGLNKTPYSQSAYKNGWRTDCSGFVARCWDLPSTNYNTANLVTSGVMRKIDINSLKPGDACGECGPGTLGDFGHVYIFDRWVNDDPNDNRMWIYEQCGGVRGPIHRIVTWPYPNVCRAYRYVNIQDQEEDDYMSDQHTFDQRFANLGDEARKTLAEALLQSDVFKMYPGAKGEDVVWFQTVVQRIVKNQEEILSRSAAGGQVDPAAVAGELAKHKEFAEAIAAAFASHVKVG